MPTLLVLLKYPIAGRVKTRLAESLGRERAAELYRQWIGQVFDRLQPLRGSVRVVGFFAGATQDAFAEWEHLADEWWPQPDGDLGARLAAGFERAHFAAEPVVAIGTDCLQIDTALVREAFARLEKHDAVFGPTPDGGYYLVGTARNLVGFFAGVPWSTADTIATHLSRCEQRGWSALLLPQRRDIDTVDDWLALCGESKATVPSIAVVIPTLNEEAVLGDTLESVRSQADESVRIVVADGGSTDATVAIAKHYAAQIVQSPRRGRGCQVAAAVAALQDDVVLVLHADARLPPGAIDRVRDWMAEHANCPGGCLGHRFDSPRASHRWIEALDRLRARRGVSYGDQAQFFRQAMLAGRGGFPDQSIMEDIELSRRLRALGRAAYLDCPVLASPRRLERLGWWQSVAANFVLRTAYRVGGTAVCDRLYRLYYRQPKKPGFSTSMTTEVSP